MPEKTVEQHVVDINAKLSGLDDMIKARASQQDFDGLKTELVEISTQLKGKEGDEDAKGVIDKLDGLIKSVEDQGIAMQQIQDSTPVKEKTIKELLTEKRDDLKNIGARKMNSTHIEMKTDVWTGSITNSTISTRLPGVGQLPFDAGVIAPLFNQGKLGPGSGGVLRYVDQQTLTRNAEEKAEKAEKPESAIVWYERTTPLEVIADTIPVTMQALDDIDFMASEINNFLLNNLKIRLNTQLIAGTGVTPLINGLLAQAPNFAAVASGIPDANIYDLIAFMKSGVEAGTSGKYACNYVIMNPADVLQMRLHKDANNNYVIPPFVSRDGLQVSGLTVIEAAAMTTDHLVVGDFKYGTLWQIGGINLDIGWIDKQFIENMVTVRAEMRVQLLIRNADTTGFLESTGIDADLVTLAT